MSKKEWTPYRERAILVALMATQWPAVISYNDHKEPEWAVIYIRTSEGQLSWHIAPEDMDLFKHVDIVPPDDVIWDGHSTELKYERIQSLINKSVVERVLHERIGY